MPPIAPRASRIAYVLPGHSSCRWQAAPMPDRPAPTTRTSTCSVPWAHSRGSAGGDRRRVDAAARGLLRNGAAPTLSTHCRTSQHGVEKRSARVISPRGRPRERPDDRRRPRPSSGPPVRGRPGTGHPRHRRAADLRAAPERHLGRRPGARRRHLPAHLLLLLRVQGRRPAHAAGPRRGPGRRRQPRGVRPPGRADRASGWRRAITAYYDTFRAHRALTLAWAEARSTSPEIRELWAQVFDNWAHRAPRPSRRSGPGVRRRRGRRPATSPSSSTR